MPSHHSTPFPDRDLLYLAIRRCDMGTGALFVVEGEIDPDTAPSLRGALRRGLLDGRRDIDVDMSGVTFCDSSGLHVFLDISCEAADAGGCLRLHRPSPIVARLLTLTRTGTLLYGLPVPPPPVPVVVATVAGQAVRATTRGSTNGHDKPTAERMPGGPADSAAEMPFRAR